jgi:hypothetical protein
MMKRVLILALFAAACTAHAEKKDKVYTVETATDPSAVAAGSQAVFQITITPKAPWVLKTTTPMKITLEGSDGVKLAKKKLSNKDITDAKNAAKSVKAGFEATHKGSQHIDADMSFFLCTEEICQRYTDKAGAEFTVN